MTDDRLFYGILLILLALLAAGFWLCWSGLCTIASWVLDRVDPT